MKESRTRIGSILNCSLVVGFIFSLMHYLFKNQLAAVEISITNLFIYLFYFQLGKNLPIRKQENRTKGKRNLTSQLINE